MDVSPDACSIHVENNVGRGLLINCSDIHVQEPVITWRLLMGTLTRPTGCFYF